MKKIAVLVIIILVTVSCGAQNTSQTTSDRAAIRAVMAKQEQAWSNHDLEGFMEGYWKSDSLKFFGKSGLTTGWKQTLENYKKGYPTKADSGTLTFTIEDMTQIEANSYHIMGNYYLKRTVGDANGVFMIIFKKIKGQWKIVADMSCG